MLVLNTLSTDISRFAALVKLIFGEALLVMLIWVRH